MSEAVALCVMRREAMEAGTYIADALDDSQLAHSVVLLEKAAEHLSRAIAAAKEAAR